MSLGNASFLLATTVLTLVTASVDAQDRAADSVDAAGPATRVQVDPWAAVSPLPEDQQPLQRGRKREAARPTSDSADKAAAGASWIRTTASLAGVVALILLLAWGYTVAAGGKIGLARLRRPGLIDVISRANLSARHGLALVRVGPRLVLVGVSQNGLRALDVIDDPALTAQLAADAAHAGEKSVKREFTSCIEDEASRYPVRLGGAGAESRVASGTAAGPRLDGAVSATHETLEGERLARARQSLAAAVRRLHVAS